MINNAPSPLLAVLISSSGQTASAQINFQVPLERNASLLLAAPPSGYSGTMAVAQVSDGLVNGMESSVLINIASPTAFPAPTGWGGFFADANGYAIAQHASDYSLVTLQNPARPGETVVVYADDFLQTWPPPPIGAPAPLQSPSQILPSYLVYTASAAGSSLFLQTYPTPNCNPTLIGAAGGTYAALEAGNSMEVAIGAGHSATSPVHFAYRAGTGWLDATGEFFDMTVESRGAAGFARGAWTVRTLPILYPGAVAATEGCSASFCITAVGHAFLKSWGF